MSSRLFVERPQTPNILPFKQAIPALAVTEVGAAKAIKGTPSRFLSSESFLKYVSEISVRKSCRS